MASKEEAYKRYRFWPLSKHADNSSVSSHFLYENGWVAFLDEEPIHPHRYLTIDEFEQMCQDDPRMAAAFNFNKEQ